MEIAINTSPLVSGHKTRGIGVYTQQLITELQKNTTITLSYFTDKLPQNADIIHYPFFDPFFLTLPIKKPIPVVVTVHDVIPLIFPKYFPSGIRGGIKWQIQKFSLQSAAAIITDSECSRADIIRICGYPRSKVHVVPLAPSVEFLSASTTNVSMSVVKKYNLPDRFILYVGDINWNKNIPKLLEASAHLHITLVLVGSAFENVPIAQSNVITLGYVPTTDLAVLYALARASVFPSFYEGFGLPILEAMASGGVVVCSKEGSLQEIKGPAIIVDPYQTDSIERGIVEALALDSTKRQDMITQGLEWVKKYTWIETANKTIAVYKSVFSNL